MRPSCHVGVIVASGHLYWVPWACDCNLQMFGAISCGPAGNFDFAAKATDAERLETAPGAAAVAKFDLSPNDWPAYRRDNVRSAKTAVAVPAKVRLLWQFEPKSACDATAPVAAGGMVFTAGLDGIVRAFVAADGSAKWTAYTGGPVRYPPTVAGGRVFVGSADGWAYAFEAATGRMLWRFRAAPAERKIPVYGALVSTWPVACGVMVDGGTAYLAAGMNNFDGTYLYALDAATGRIKWQNGGAGHLDSFSKRGVAAQGDMLLDGGNLYLAGGNVVSPGIFEASSGKCLNQPPPALGTPAPRGRELVLANGQVNVRGQPLYSTTGAPVFDKKSEWDTPVVAAGNANIACIKAKAGQGPAWSLVARAAADNAEIWTQPLPAEPVRWGMAVDRDGRIVVSLRSGRVLCFGAEK
jgi:outer membrane protein assembly factor BamB